MWVSLSCVDWPKAAIAANIQLRCSLKFAYSGLIRLCMLCLVVVLMDGVITMRVDFEWQILVSKPNENPGILQNVRLVAQIITKI